MNIIKFRDIVIDHDIVDDEGHVVITQEDFNTNFRNHYFYAIHMNRVLPLDLPLEDYVILERQSDPVAGISLEHLEEYMDIETTTKIANDEQIKYEYLNNFTPDDDITIDELKMFRTWLATLLLKNTPVIESWKDPDTLTFMLSYYANNMYDNVIKMLSSMENYMGKRSLVINNTSELFAGLAALKKNSGCGCNGWLTGMTSINGTTLCDPVQMYRNAIYNYMVDTFSNLDYWTAQVEICSEMKKYIDGILKVGLPLSSTVIDPYADCTCTVNSEEAERYKMYLRNLSKSLQYIIDSEVEGNKNFIRESFNNWATYLYERMQW